MTHLQLRQSNFKEKVKVKVKNTTSKERQCTHHQSNEEMRKLCKKEKYTLTLKLDWSCDHFWALLLVKVINLMLVSTKIKYAKEHVDPEKSHKKSVGISQQNEDCFQDKNITSTNIIFTKWIKRDSLIFFFPAWQVKIYLKSFDEDNVYKQSPLTGLLSDCFKPLN